MSGRSEDHDPSVPMERFGQGKTRAHQMKDPCNAT